MRVCAGMAEKGEEEYRRRSRRRKFDYFIFLTNPDTGNDETESIPIDNLFTRATTRDRQILLGGCELCILGRFILLYFESLRRN